MQDGGAEKALRVHRTGLRSCLFVRSLCVRPTEQHLPLRFGAGGQNAAASQKAILQKTVLTDAAVLHQNRRADTASSAHLHPVEKQGFFGPDAFCQQTAVAHKAFPAVFLQIAEKVRPPVAHIAPESAILKTVKRNALFL